MYAFAMNYGLNVRTLRGDAANSVGWTLLLKDSYNKLSLVRTKGFISERV
jgi:hypothetical protein